MRLVNYRQRDGARFRRTLDRCSPHWLLESFRRHHQHQQRSVVKALLSTPFHFIRPFPVKPFDSPNSRAYQPILLILDEGNQGGHHKGCSWAKEGRKMKNQALPSPSRQEHNGVLSVETPDDRFLLPFSKSGLPKRSLKDPSQGLPTNFNLRASCGTVCVPASPGPCSSQQVPDSEWHSAEQLGRAVFPRQSRATMAGRFPLPSET